MVDTDRLLVAYARPLPVPGQRQIVRISAGQQI